jgi:Enoyl-CoA hydratase/isomerase
MAVEAQEMVLSDVRAGVAQITLNRPAVANALAPEQRDQLIDLFQDYSRDPAVRVVVLRSTGAHFCAGADLQRIGQSRATDAIRVGAGSDRIRTGALRLIARLPWRSCASWSAPSRPTTRRRTGSRSSTGCRPTRCSRSIRTPCASSPAGPGRGRDRCAVGNRPDVRA